LGPLQVTLDGKPITDFKSSKVRALLAYLAVEADRPHRRDVLAGLLWPDWPDREALSNLRYALSNLRRVIGDSARSGDRGAEPPYLLVSRQSLQFNTASDSWLDVAAFAEKVEVVGSQALALEQVEEAVSLYQGPFLEGFTVGDSAAFEEWALLKREQLARQMTAALHRLAAAYEEQGEYEKAQSYAWRQVELEPWDEVAHRTLMRTLALGRKRSRALAQYETCRRLLAEELGVEPSAETTRLYEQVRDGDLQAPGPAAVRVPVALVELPAFLDEELVEVERPIFVARERELAQLDGLLELALAGQGRVTFVIGNAGCGKTALIQEFARRAQVRASDLIVAGGQGNAHTGVGDPYLPFREILGLLSGDVEAEWAAGAMTREQARRLWYLLPLAVQALVKTGPDLIDTFVPGTSLLERAAAHALGRRDWLASLEQLVHRRATGPAVQGPQQSDLFEQYTRVVQALARKAPLVLVVDDLQWADLGSISLLFHLGRHLAGRRILVVGAYRPEEVSIGRDGERHPLAPVVSEFQRQFGDLVVDVDQAERRQFMEALLDQEPNRLGPSFRQMLYLQARGHPLFTIELLRGMQERGDLVQDEKGRWEEGPTLDWETMPARVEAVVAERVGRLDRSLRAKLRVASVEGEVFTAEVVAWVQGTGEQETLGHLSGELDRRHRLVRAQSIQRIDGQRLSRYRFRHILFQRYLYSSLDEVERVFLHEQVGTALEELYGAQEKTAAARANAVQLAWHFQEARITEKAIDYLHQAGDKAVRLSAYQEATAHLTQALELLKALPNSGDADGRLARAEQELALQISLAMAWKWVIPNPEGERVLTKARELCEQTGRTTELCRVVGELSIFPYVRAEYRAARELGEEALSLAKQVGDPLLVAIHHWHLGYILVGLGEFSTARAHFEQVIAFYEPHAHHESFVLLRGSDAGVSALAYDACCLWCLGYPEQADKRSQKALALARELDHPFSLADVLAFGGCVFNKVRREGLALKAHGQELVELSEDLGFSSFMPTGTCYLGDGLAMLGQVQEGLALMREGLEGRQSTGVRCYFSGTLGGLAEALAMAGRPDEGLATLDEAFSLVEETDERYCEAELYRVQAELLLQQGEEAGAEIALGQALEVARRQCTKSWELRATTSLARLWQKQGRAGEARQALAAIYEWFTEGFDTPDLMEARALLEELS
jgi:DNA-binding SARP family transcriptional activator/predicted ATPase